MVNRAPLTIGFNHLFTGIFADHSREAVADTLDAVDPFGLLAGVIVERVLALGNVPDVAVPRLTMWPTIGRVFEVCREEQD